MVSIHLGFPNYSVACVFFCFPNTFVLTRFWSLRKKRETRRHEIFSIKHCRFPFIFTRCIQLPDFIFAFISQRLAPGNKVGAVGRHERTSRQWRRRRRRTFFITRTLKERLWILNLNFLVICVLFGWLNEFCVVCAVLSLCFRNNKCVCSTSGAARVPLWTN